MSGFYVLGAVISAGQNLGDCKRGSGVETGVSVAEPPLHGVARSWGLGMSGMELAK